MPQWLRDTGVANLIVLASVAVALLALAITSWFSKRTERREEARDAEREREARRAHLTVYRDDDRLVIYNEGPGTAYEIRVMIEGKPINEHPAVIQPPEVIPVLGRGAEYRFVTFVEYLFRQPTRPLTIEIRWRDDSGYPGTYLTSLAYT